MICVIPDLVLGRRAQRVRIPITKTYAVGRLPVGVSNLPFQLLTRIERESV